MYRYSLILILIIAFLPAITFSQENSKIVGQVQIKSSITKKKVSGLGEFYKKSHTKNHSAESGKIEAVVFIVNEMEDNWTHPLENPKVVQQNEAFVPHVLPIRVSTTVDFPNYDKIYHNVFSFSKAKTFDLGRYAKGKSKSIKFDKPGIVQVFCEIHSHMHAYILVLPNKYFAKTTSDGKFEIKDLPPGEYQISAWHKSFPEHVKNVKVGKSETVELNFEF